MKILGKVAVHLSKYISEHIGYVYKQTNFTGPLMKMSSTPLTSKEDIDWNYLSILNYLYLHIPLKLLELAAYSNLISTQMKHLLIQAWNICMAPILNGT